MSRKDIEKELEELSRYADLEGSEVGEMCGCLIHLAQSYEPYVSEEFYNILENEIMDQLENFKTRTKIVKRKIKIEPKVIEELEWI